MHDDSGEGIEVILPTDEEAPAEIVSHQEDLSELAKAVSLLTPRENLSPSLLAQFDSVKKKPRSGSPEFHPVHPGYGVQLSLL